MHYSRNCDSYLNTKIKTESSPAASPPLDNPRDGGTNIMFETNNKQFNHLDDSDGATGLP